MAAAVACGGANQSVATWLREKAIIEALMHSNDVGVIVAPIRHEAALTRYLRISGEAGAGGR